jgi:hypothetical protein
LIVNLKIILIKKAAKQLEECAEEIVNLKVRCDSQEKELEKHRNQLSRTEMMTSSQLADKDDQLNKFQAEVKTQFIQNPAELLILT